MDNIKVLMVDDESRMRKLVSDFLTRKGYIVIEAGDGEEALDRFYADKDISLVILDVMMPKMNGWDVCREIRKNSKVPIIMLTAKGTEYDKVLGLDSGADDYIAKPFGTMELVSRIKALLRRTDGNTSRESYTQDGLYLEPARHIVRVNGRDVTLTFKEFELLCMLFRNRGVVLTRDRILNEVWGYAFDGENRTVDVHIRTLRAKLGECGDLIETVRGVGYKIGGNA